MNRSCAGTHKHGSYSEDLSRPLPGTIVGLAESTGLHLKVTKHNSLQTLYNQVCPVLIGPPLRGWDTKACAHSPCACSSLNAAVLSSRTSDHRPRALQSERQRVPREVSGGGGPPHGTQTLREGYSYNVFTEEGTGVPMCMREANLPVAPWMKSPASPAPDLQDLCALNKQKRLSALRQHHARCG